MRRATLCAALAVMPLLRAGAALPAEVVVTAPATFEIMRGERVSGTIALQPGARLDVVNLAGEHVLVRYRNVNGRVLAARTNLPLDTQQSAADLASRAPAAADPGAPRTSQLPAAATEPLPTAAAPPSVIQRALAGNLVRLERGAVRPHDPTRLAGIRFYAFYFSASWCGPCREFTPELVDAYGKIRSVYPEFEVVFVSSDRSADAMLDYMRHDRMPWPALAWPAIGNTAQVTRYRGSGIPCLVLVDADGKVLSHSFRSGRYVGPDRVLDDTWKILRDHRRKNARPKS